MPPDAITYGAGETWRRFFKENPMQGMDADFYDAAGSVRVVSDGTSSGTKIETLTPDGWKPLRGVTRLSFSIEAEGDPELVTATMEIAVKLIHIEVPPNTLHYVRA